VTVEQGPLRTKATRWVLAALFALLPLAGCARMDPVAASKRDVRHVIIVIQENRSFDNLFHGYPGADTVDFGFAHNGQRVKLMPISLRVNYDISHGFQDFARAYDGGKMDGFDLAHAGAGPRAPATIFHTQYPQYGFVPRAESKPYWEMAQQFALSDRMFQSNLDQSFAAHLYLIAGQAGRSVNVPNGRPWGCDAGPRTTVRTLTLQRTAGKRVFPCFSFRTLADELDEKNISWRYYAPAVDSRRTWQRYLYARNHHLLAPNTKPPEFGQLWSAFDAVGHIRFGADWATNVSSPETGILRDIVAGQLSSVSWVVPDMRNSDHSISRSDSGPEWVAAIVNTLGESKYWNDTVVFVLWDDSGGWYDHVPPPQLDYDGLGDRVPLLAISRFAKRNYVSSTQLEFGSILKFTETVFGLSALSESDRRAHDLLDMFAFDQGYRDFVPITVRHDAKSFLRQRPSLEPPDDN
jgi:phospholipase C